MLRVCRIWFELLAQLQYLVINCPCSGVCVVSPDLIQQELPCQDAIHVLCKEFQKLEFMGREDYRNSASSCAHAIEVKFAFGKAKRAWMAGFTLPTNRSLHAGHKLAWT